MDRIRIKPRLQLKEPPEQAGVYVEKRESHAVYTLVRRRKKERKGNESIFDIISHRDRSSYITIPVHKIDADEKKKELEFLAPSKQ